MKDSTKFRLFLIIATTIWGANFYFAKFMLKESSFIEAAAWRYIFGVGTLVLLTFKSLQTLKISKLPLKGILLVGIIGLFGFSVFFFYGLQYTSAVNAALIVSLNPVTTLFLSFLILKTKLTKFQIIGAVISLVGVAYLLAKGNIFSFTEIELNYGDLLIFLANIFFALHHIWVKQYRKEVPNAHFTSVTNAICLFGFIFLALFTGEEIAFDHSGVYWISAIGIGTFGTAVAYIVWNQGIHHLGADKAAIYMNIVPLATAIMAIFLGEELFLYHLISGTIIIFGLFVSNRK